MGITLGIMKARLRQTLGDLLPYSLNIRKYGLRNDHFKNFFYLLNDRALYLGTVKKYLPFLLPRETISEQNIVKIIGRLSRNGDDLRTVNAFLKWTIVVFDYLDSTETIRKLYSVLFHYLGFSTTRASICHLLYFITRKEDVTPYRIRKLKSLVDQEKENRSLIGLLMVYNSFDKSVEVPVNVRLRDMFVFEHPDPAMKAELKQIKEYWGEKEQVRGMTKPRLRLPQKQSDVSGRKKKRSKETEEPHLDTISMMDLYNDLLHLQHSNQLQKILDDRKIQHLLVCNPNDDAIIRLSYYLGHQLLSTVRWNNNIDKPELQELLKKLLRLAQFSKSQLPIVNLFLREYLRSWNGIEFQDEILGLISFIKPADYEELYQNILLPLYRKYYVLDVTWKAKLINCYTGWLKNWALLDWRGHKEQEENETSDTDVDKITWMFEGLSLRVDYFVTIQRVIEHVDKISIVGLLAENDDPLLQHATLSFFELVANIPLQHDIPEIIVPSIDLVCRCFFSSNAMALSRICGIICQYVVAFSENDKKDDDWLSRHSPDYLTMFNTYVTDICNALWKNKSLTIGGNAMAFALSEENIENFTGICNTRGDDLGSFSSLTQSGSLTGFSKSFLNELENQQGKSIYHKEVVTAESLQQLQEQGGISIDYFEYRVKFLNYLTSKGLDGIQELLSSSMKSLIKYRRD
ncbi:Mis6-domain-containing protein [Thamnidium elegans]|nr:Mis6-domain-containing protein [Thamnidium elegans]